MYLWHRYIVKQSESLDELTLTFPEGVVATFQLLPGYPEVRPIDDTRTFILRCASLLCVQLCRRLFKRGNTHDFSVPASTS